MSARSLQITGARENNLKNLSLELPHDSLTVVTGLSGSGKSSLAFDTVYAEGQRRYLETFSPYTRQFLDRTKKPAVDAVENVRPAIAIQQRTRVTGSRSTVGSMTNINDFLRLFWAHAAEAVCPSCAVPFEQWNAQKLSEHLYCLAEMKNAEALLVGAELAVPAKLFQAERERLLALGFARAWSEETGELTQIEALRAPKHGEAKLFVILDRLRPAGPGGPRPAALKQLRESVTQAFELGRGSCSVVVVRPAARSRPWLSVLNDPAGSNVRRATHERLLFFAVPRCPYSDIKVARPRPALFSFNHPLGACPTCKGFGRVLEIDRERCVPNPSLSISKGAVQCWSGERARGEYRKLLAFCKQRGIPVDAPWRELPAESRREIFEHRSKQFRGILPWFERVERKAYKMHVRVFLSKYRAQVTCPACRGARLVPDALAYGLGGRTIADLQQLPIAELSAWLAWHRQALSERGTLPKRLRDVLDGALLRLRFLIDLGLPYLTLDRPSRTLSGGETQRVNLVTALGSGIVSTHFVLDEPSVGLHARDTERLIRSVERLRDDGNSVLVVEHDPDFVAAADAVVELGPAAGRAGGEIVYNGPAGAWGKDLAARAREIAVAAERRKIAPPFREALRIRGASERNLKQLSFDLPLGAFVSITGVSGSGKSTLAHEVIQRAYDAVRSGADDGTLARTVEGFDALAQVLTIDQAPLAKSPRANIGTYSGIWEEVRKILAATDDSLKRGLGPATFSFNVDGGRCPACKGAGFIREDMQFLSDVFIPCEVCLGRRFQDAVLAVQYKGKRVDELLAMTAEECRAFFGDRDRIASPAGLLVELGLGHLTLGHPLSELSGGEAQRLKLVPFIESSARGGETGRSLLIFDEPTTGLHVEDVARLVQLLRKLVHRGHSVVCVEHNLLLIAASDWIVDLGPEGGSGGGELVASGPVEAFLSEELRRVSHTARHLTRFLEPPRSGRAAAANKRGARSVTRPESLVIHGAREHNLKNIDVEVPLGELVALAGISGSGKSTIAKDIMYAEGQRRFLDCLSPYARQFVEELKRPEIDGIDNVPPAICVYQHTFQPGRLSTIGTMSEAYHYLRLLYAKLGVQYCPDHPAERIAPLGAAEIAAFIREFNRPVRLLAPIIKHKKGSHREVLQRAVDAEISQVRIDGVFLSPASVSFSGGLPKSKPHTIEFVIGKLTPTSVPQEILTEAVAQALSLGGGNIIVHSDRDETVLSTERTCPVCRRGFFRPDPEDLSFHSKRGRCLTCDGTGAGARGEACGVCGGTRLNEIGRNLRLGGLNIAEAAALTPPALREFLRGLTWSGRERYVSEGVVQELESRLETLAELGLDYVPLARDCRSLSGGELQRLRLAAAMGSPLSGALYILDEPSAGLHPVDNRKVLRRLGELRARENSVVVIEHDPETIRASEHIIEIGPGAGRDGGTVVYSGSTQRFVESADTVTARAVRDELPPPQPSNGAPRPQLVIEHGACNNIEDLSLSVPLNALVAVGGVSGAGKSSLVHGIIRAVLQDGKQRGAVWTLGATRLTSEVPIERVLVVDQRPIGINARSTPASYLKVFDGIRKLFAATLESKARGWSAGFFSYNTGAGRCPVCRGLGSIRLEMSFLPDAEVLCESCRGGRFTDEADSVLYQGLTIGAALRLTFEEARTKFAHHRAIIQPLRQACDLGLGYLALGQPSTTLSGGESQRIKLVSELSTARRGHTLYVLDEPTTGLHRADVGRLLRTIRELVDRGNTVLVVEHDRDVITGADHLIELGPGPGSAGGRVIFSGHPSELLSAPPGTPWACELSGSGTGSRTPNFAAASAEFRR